MKRSDRNLFVGDFVHVIPLGRSALRSSTATKGHLATAGFLAILSETKQPASVELPGFGTGNGT